MIFGVGTDIIRIARIESALDRHGERFMEKILGIDEQAIYRQRYTLSKTRGVRYLATRFAAKEAFSKAAGLGMRAPMTWQVLQLLNVATGKPLPVITGDMKNFMQDNALTAHISISDENDYAVAFVILEKK